MTTSPPRSHIISIVNQKGGVGKTTTAVNLATALAATGKKTLIIDLDPQGNASTGFGIESADRKDRTIYDVITDNTSIDKTIFKTTVPGLKIIPSSVDLSAAEVELVNCISRETYLAEKLALIQADFEYILIDCPPSLGLLTLNALVASDAVMIPLQCEFFALEGLGHLLNTISLVKKKLNTSLDIHGVLLTMYDKRNKLTEQVELDVRKHLGDKVYQTVIPRNIKISEAPSHGKPAIIYDYKCSGSMAYLHLAKEILFRNHFHQPPLAEAV